MTRRASRPGGDGRDGVLGMTHGYEDPPLPHSLREASVGLVSAPSDGRLR